MFETSFVDQVRERTELLDLVGSSVKLKKAGKDYTGLCPFHTEKSPSFSVSPTKQFYHCFGCGAHGDAIGWMMDFGGLSFPDAVGELARSAGMDLPQYAAPTPVQVAQKAKALTLVEVLARAKAFYSQNVRGSADAVEYLRNRRGLRAETVVRFGIGYAQRGGIAEHLSDVSQQTLIDAGLLVENEDSTVVRDKFRNRIMFPIHNERGDVVGFGGRVLDDSEPKYLNSPESDVFHKGEELFGLHIAKQQIRQSRVAVVVEGYMDVVMLHQHGEPRAVAALGTSLTEPQIVRLFKLADEVVFCFDGDGAGQRAADRAARIALEVIPEGKRARFVTLPNEHDPDSFVATNGIEGWRQFLHAEGQPLSAKLVAILTHGRDLSVVEDRTLIAREATDLLGTVRFARMFQTGLRTEFEKLVGLRLKVTAVEAAVVESNGDHPRPDPERTAFYRRFALLCGLDSEAVESVPEDLLDEFSALISGWFAVAPAALQERITSITTLRNSALRKVIISSLEGLRERETYLAGAGLREEVEAILEGMSVDLARNQREQAASALFA